jgi:23S rRNA-intervening sequence protein
MKRIPARSFQGFDRMAERPPICTKRISLYKQFPKEEIYSLTSQFRRAAVSTPANIAEGFKKKTRSDKARFMNIFARLFGGMPVLSYPRGGSWVRQQCVADVTTRGGQQVARKLQSSDHCK